MVTGIFCLALSLLPPACLGTFLAQRTQKVTEGGPDVSAIRSEDMEFLWRMTDEVVKPSKALQKQTWQSYRPCATCKEFVRVGEGHDGGYVMCGELIKSTKAVYSYGINGFDGWGAAMSHRLGGVVVQQYDCFNLTRPHCPSNLQCKFAFHAECLATTSKTVHSRQFASLTDQMTKNGHLPGAHSSVDMVMKIDVEGAEWEVLADERNKPLLKHVSQLVVEFHGVHEVTPTKAKAMQNLLDLFAIVHVHANNCCSSLKTSDGYTVPKVLEVSFVRRGLVEDGTCEDAPAKSTLDHPNVEGKHDVPQMKLGPTE